jgi:hypothetical protein
MVDKIWIAFVTSWAVRMPPLAITTISSRMLSVTTNHADCVDGVAI